jgi:hypothetical protein
MSTINWPWAIILCRFSDIADEPQPVDYYEDLFTQNGTGGVCDYFRTVSCDTLDLTGSRVFGWFNSGHTSVEYAQLASQFHSGSRGTVVQWGKDAATAAGVNLAPFRNVLVLFNFKTTQHDHGAAGVFEGAPVLILQAGANICEFGFICHEMGHGLGLEHTWSANPDFKYGDGWDLMSWQTTQFTYSFVFRGTSGLATVGLNAHNLAKLNAIPNRRTWSPSHSDFSEEVVLDPLGQSAIGNHGFLVAKIEPQATSPVRSNSFSYLAEFRRKAGWDQAIPRDAVLIHEVRTDGNSYIQPARWNDYVIGDLFMTPDPKVFIQVTGIDSATGVATLRVWDVPEGSLRKEDTGPKVYLIRNGAKRWVLGPQVLFGLGKTWSDVRVVPDGGLNILPNGPDLDLLHVVVVPYPVPINKAVTVMVHANAITSGLSVAGQVKIKGVVVANKGVVVANTNTRFTYTFKPKRKLVSTHPREWEVTYPQGVVVASGYPNAPIDFGFPD